MNFEFLRNRQIFRTRSQFKFARSSLRNLQWNLILSQHQSILGRLLAKKSILAVLSATFSRFSTFFRIRDLVFCPVVDFWAPRLISINRSIMRKTNLKEALNHIPRTGCDNSSRSLNEVTLLVANSNQLAVALRSCATVYLPFFAFFEVAAPRTFLKSKYRSKS